MPEQTLNGPMDLGTAHRPIGCCQHLDDGSLNHAIAEPAHSRKRLRAATRLDRIAGSASNTAARGAEGFESCPTKLHLSGPKPPRIRESASTLRLGRIALEPLA